MFLERTIAQLDPGPVSPDEALALAHLGYLQWLSGLKGDADYRLNAMHAYEAAAPYKGFAPAIAIFCDLLIASAQDPLQVRPLAMPARKRSGGAGARRRRRLKL